jgi:hypothetical protein
LLDFMCLRSTLAVIGAPMLGLGPAFAARAPAYAGRDSFAALASVILFATPPSSPQ